MLSGGQTDPAGCGVLVVRSMGFRLTRETKYHPCLFITQEFCAQVGTAAACKRTALTTGPISYWLQHTQLTLLLAQLSCDLAFRSRS